MSKKEFIDSHLNKWISRKLLVFLIASIALFLNKITGTDWVIVSAVYLSVQSTIDVYEKLMATKENISNYNQTPQL